MSQGKLRVAILFGGRSGEHDVSRLSAASIMQAIDRNKYEVIPVAISRAGRWILPADVERALSEGIESVGGEPVALVPDPTVGGLLLLDGSGGAGIPSGRWLAVDVVFPVLHGPHGEDGTIQGVFELANLPYVGAGVLASAVAMDKVIMKDLFVRHQLPTPRYRAYRSSAWHADPGAVIRDVEATLGYPVFVKPANLGSSVGVHKCRDRAELTYGCTDAARYDRKIIVEEAIPQAREIEVSVLGNEEPLPSVPGEILPSREFYDYRAKYLDDASQLLIPAPLDDEQAHRVRELAVAAYRAVQAEGMARVDFFISRETGRVYVNEVNTIPGFTRISMYPKLWEASGLPYPDLIDRLIQLALERWRQKQALQTSFHPE